MDVSIIIVNYNTLKMTNECIHSICEYTRDVKFEIILVDNASKDGSKEFFSQDRRIKYIYSEHNIGFGCANNIGYKVAQGRYIFLLNSDTLLKNNAVKIFFNNAEASTSDIVCFGCILKDEQFNDIHSFGKFPNSLNLIYEWIFYPFLKKIGFNIKLRKYDYSDHIKEDFFDVDYITGAALFIKKELCLDKELFDPDFFMYFEETEMQRRFYKRNLRRIIIKSPLVMHLEGKSFSGKTLQKREMVLKSLFIYMSKDITSWRYSLFHFTFKLLYIFSFLLSNYSLSEKKKHLRIVYNL